MTTEIKETIYSIFQTIAGDDMKKLIKGIPEPRIISYSSKNFSFIRRAIPTSLITDLSSYFSKTLFFEELSPENGSEHTGSFCAFCLDDNEEVRRVLELLKLVTNCKLYIVLIPRVTTSCQEEIDRSGLDITTLELPLEIIPLEENMFLVPSPRCFSRCFIQNDINDIYTIARSLLKLQLFTGGVERTFYAGEMSQRVFTLLEQMKNQCGYSNFKDPQFDDIFIIDRTVDLVTPLASQFYYGGLLDDLFDYEYGYFKLPFGIEIQDQPDTTEVLFSDLNDDNFKVLRGMSVADTSQHFTDQLALIQKVLSDLQASLGTVEYGPIAKRAVKLKDEKPILELHQNLVNKILSQKNFMADIYNYEYSILIQNPLDLTIIKQLIGGGRIIEALRLLCFASLVSPDEISAKNVEDLQRRIIGYCGFEATSDLIGLEKSGLFSNDSSFFSKLNFKQTPKFKDLDSTLRLLVPSQSSFQDINKGYDGYVPIMHRIVQSALFGDWEKGYPVDKLLNKMKIPHEISGTVPQTDTGIQTRKVLVFVIGGITQTEISLFNEMGKTIFKNRYEFHVGSTEITNGRELIESVCPCVAAKSVK
ncbi:Vacuolar protein-sorting-associated protein 33 [Tritrichomonas musculus]|uniref:Vacuolar protein-sorting-associated protein 33 n=1 Tax=Tritrichomonas musculus TaxID=1915356 RepID=A0ABR2KCU9_9EUKA